MASDKHKISSWQFIALGYLLLIMIGSLLLSLPIASKSGQWTPYINSLFTSTSATCVTGLVVYDTFTHWSIFGQIVILLQIQIGGIGFMTVFTLFAMMVKKHIGLYERKVIMQSANSNGFSGLIKLIKRILVGTLIFESVGTILLSIRFIPELGFGRGLYYSLFHSISAFCNSGFDLMGFQGQFSSFQNYTGDPLVTITLMALIFMGGLGFLVWSDIYDCKLNAKKFHLHTKIVLTASIAMLAINSMLFFIFEKDNLFSNMSPGKALLASLFQAITPRTAGFNTIDTYSLSDSSALLTMIIMFIGGGSGSTAGGIKITTFVVILLGIFSVAKKEDGINIGKKRLDAVLLPQALTISASYIIIILISAIMLTAIEPASFKAIIFEVVSAIGTVGLSMNLTPTLSVLSRIVIILLMFIGKVGIITIVFSFERKQINPPIKRPIDKILIG